MSWGRPASCSSTQALWRVGHRIGSLSSAAWNSTAPTPTPSLVISARWSRLTMCYCHRTPQRAASPPGTGQERAAWPSTSTLIVHPNRATEEEATVTSTTPPGTAHIPSPIATPHHPRRVPPKRRIAPIVTPPDHSLMRSGTGRWSGTTTVTVGDRDIERLKAKNAPVYVPISASGAFQGGHYAAPSQRSDLPQCAGSRAWNGAFSSAITGGVRGELVTDWKCRSFAQVRRPVHPG
jgi:hypothetical protein